MPGALCCAGGSALRSSSIKARGAGGVFGTRYAPKQRQRSDYGQDTRWRPLERRARGHAVISSPEISLVAVPRAPALCRRAAATPLRCRAWHPWPCSHERTPTHPCACACWTRAGHGLRLSRSRSRLAEWEFGPGDTHTRSARGDGRPVSQARNGRGKARQRDNRTERGREAMRRSRNARYKRAESARKACISFGYSIEV